MEYDEQYWKDYTAFLNEVDRISHLGSNDLLAHYTKVVEALEKNELFESIFEQDHEEIDFDEHEIRTTIEHIHNLIGSENLKDNVLRNILAVKVHALNLRLEKFIKLTYKKDKQWLTAFKLDMVEWNGSSKDEEYKSATQR